MSGTAGFFTLCGESLAQVEATWKPGAMEVRRRSWKRYSPVLSFVKTILPTVTPSLWAMNCRAKSLTPSGGTYARYGAMRGIMLSRETEGGQGGWFGRGWVGYILASRHIHMTVPVLFGGNRSRGLTMGAMPHHATCRNGGLLPGTRGRILHPVPPAEARTRCSYVEVSLYGSIRGRGFVPVTISTDSTGLGPVSLSEPRLLRLDDGTETVEEQ